MGTPKGTVPWNAGKGVGWTDKRGYRWNYVTENGRKVARREHRILMEKHLGRKLEPWELVHHKDGDKSNNIIGNLEIQEWSAHTAEHHRGGRKSEDARRSMEAFALLREELKRQREIKAELLEALQNMMGTFDNAVRRLKMPSDFNDEAIASGRAAIAKALGTQ